jgi:DNA polymerase III sliding clamp (beta) subunit (PCNA family)
MFLLNKLNFLVAPFASKEDSRYTLKAVHVTPEYTEATDGHRLVRITTPKDSASEFPRVPGFTPNGSPKSFLLPVDAAKTIQKAVPKTHIPVVNHAAITGTGDENKPVAIAVTDLDNPQVFQPRPVTGQYPNTDIVIPKDDAAAVFQFTVRADYLAELCKAIQDFAGDGKYRPGIATLTFYGPSKAVRLDARNENTDQNLIAILMPYAGKSSSPLTPKMPTPHAPRD